MEAAQGGINIGGVIATVLPGVPGRIVVATNPDDRNAGSLQSGQLLADHHALQVARINRVEQVAGVQEGCGPALHGVAHGPPKAIAQPAATLFEPRERHARRVLAEMIVGRHNEQHHGQWPVVSG